MKKVDQLPIRITRDVPNRIQVNQGIDYYEDQITLQYDPIHADQNFSLTFLTITGESFTMPILLDSSGYKSFLPQSHFENMLVEHHFDFLEFMSRFDLILSLTIEKIDGGFQNW